MNNTFQKEIEGRQFNFEPVEFGEQSGYHVDVKDDEGKQLEFRMFGEEISDYKIEGEQLPEWLLKLEGLLKKAISEHE